MYGISMNIYSINDPNVYIYIYTSLYIYSIQGAYGISFVSSAMQPEMGRLGAEGSSK